MDDLPVIDNYRELLLQSTPMLDVRAPLEFNQGAFPNTVNLPLMTDEEREAVGIKYKQLGQDKAIELGHALVSGEVKQQRVNAWADFFNTHPNAVLYCFRGGLRSKISQQWIYQQTGIKYPRIKGGYKALRRFLIDELEKNTVLLRPIMLGGRTGIGKTLLLNQFNDRVDLEGLFHHRGSVFGKHVEPQPSQIEIENSLSVEIIKKLDSGRLHLLFEDEAPNIGSRNIPRTLFDKMRESPLVLLEEDIETRVNITFDEYITASLQQYQQYYDTDTGFQKWAEQLQTSLDKIERRLGGVRYKQMKQLMQDALQQHRSHNDSQLHRRWIETLLADYYDPMYDYQLTRKMHRVVCQGNKAEVSDFLKSEYGLI